jgi:hypothetical protein
MAHRLAAGMSPDRRKPVELRTRVKRIGHMATHFEQVCCGLHRIVAL